MLCEVVPRYRLKFLFTFIVDLPVALYDWNMFPTRHYRLYSKKTGNLLVLSLEAIQKYVLVGV